LTEEGDMHDLTTLAWIAKEHRDNMLEEVKKDRMVRAIRVRRPGFRERLFVRVGDFLISAGLRLKERYKPEMRPELEAYRSGCYKASV
jgi:hypothetical protein